MSSTERIEPSVSSRTLRKSNREKKKAEHIGHSEQSANLEELVSQLLVELLSETPIELRI